MLKKKKKKKPVFILKNNSKRKKQGWHYLAVKTLPALLRGITSNHYRDFYCFNCLHLFRTKNKSELHKKVS